MKLKHVTGSRGSLCNNDVGAIILHDSHCIVALVIFRLQSNVWPGHGTISIVISVV